MDHAENRRGVVDPEIVTLTVIIGAVVMSAGLFGVARGHLGQGRDVSRWAAATLVQATGWVLVGPLHGAIPDPASLVLGYGLLTLSQAAYLIVVAEFIKTPIRHSWVFSTVFAQSIALIYFTTRHPSATGRMVALTVCTSALMFGSGLLLWTGPDRGRPSHRFTAILFAIGGTLMLAGDLSRLARPIAPPDSLRPFMGFLTEVSYAIFFVTAPLLTFGFVLMVIDRYVAQQQTTEDALRRSEARQRAITQSAYDAIITADSAGTIVSWNRGATLEFGYEESEALGRPMSLLIPERDREAHLAAENRLARGEDPHLLGKTMELHGLRKDGTEFPLELTLSRWEGPGAWFVTAILGDITERKRAEDALRESIREKEGLLKETHHRVKNNLSLIVSLMRLSAHESREPETKAVLKEMQARIHSVSLLNETLYRTGSYTKVRLADYLGQIATHVFQAQNPDNDAIRLALDLEPVEVETAQAIPCGLIVNELMTNSLKHAFNFGGRGEVRVGLKTLPEGRVDLSVSDTGSGLPEGFSQRSHTSFGLQLVSDLARQLNGRFDVGPGATFTVAFTPRRDGDAARA